MLDNMKVEYDNELKIKCDCHFIYLVLMVVHHTMLTSTVHRTDATNAHVREVFHIGRNQIQTHLKHLTCYENHGKNNGRRKSEWMQDKSCRI